MTISEPTNSAGPEAGPSVDPLLLPPRADMAELAAEGAGVTDAHPA